MADTGQLDTKKAILEALEAKYGIVTEACRSIGLNRSTYYEWLKNDPEFKQAVEEITDTAIDYVEGKLFEKIGGVEVQTYNQKGEPVIYTQPPSDTAIIFYLKTKAKKRGYIEKSELGFTDSEGKDVQPQIIFQPAPNCKPVESDHVDPPPQVNTNRPNE